MPFTVQFTNLTQAIARLNKILPAQQKATARAAERFLKNPIFKESQQLVPVDKGDLKSTGRVDPVQIKPPFVTLVIKYGGIPGKVTGKFVGYAVRQHEDLAFRHRKGQAKYLEIPVRKHKKALRKTIEAAVVSAYNKVYAGAGI